MDASHPEVIGRPTASSVQPIVEGTEGRPRVANTAVIEQDDLVTVIARAQVVVVPATERFIPHAERRRRGPAPRIHAVAVDAGGGHGGTSRLLGAGDATRPDAGNDEAAGPRPDW
jgi:hypothetical protein